MVLAEQNKRLARLVNKADFVVTDCPLPLISYYTDNTYISGFKEFALNLFNSYDNENYLLLRGHSFETEKRNHNEHESVVIETELPMFLEQNNIKYKTFKTSEDLIDHMIQDMKKNKVLTKPQEKKFCKPNI